MMFERKVLDKNRLFLDKNYKNRLKTKTISKLMRLDYVGIHISQGRSEILLQWGQSLIGMCIRFITFSCNSFFRIFNGVNNGQNF